MEAPARPGGFPSVAAAFCTGPRIGGDGRTRKGILAFGSGSG